MIPDADAVAKLIRSVAKTEVLPRFRNLAAHEISEKKPGDLVTVADREAEVALAAELTRLLTDSAVVGEETVEIAPQTLGALDGEKPVWIIDPVDGTQNFAKGDPCFAMIVALVKRGETLAGWIHEPATNRLVWAVKGQGAWEGSRRLTLPPAPALSAFQGSVGPFIRDHMRTAAQGSGRDLPQSMTRYRCVGAEYADLARGRLHFACYGGQLKPWDHAAGALIHDEAGGHGAMIESGVAYRPRPPGTQQTFLLAPNAGSWSQLTGLMQGV
ncbi:MAG: inositol monophosphatase [Rhodospirillaceae bacterium]